MVTERPLQHYIISQKVLTMSDPNVPSLFLCRAILTVTSWPLLYILYTTEQSPSWEASRSSAPQEIPCILWKTKVHFRIYKSSPPVPTLSQINPIHALLTNISLKSILISPRSSKSSLIPRFPHQKYIHPNSWPKLCMQLLLLLLLLLIPCVIQTHPQLPFYSLSSNSLRGADKSFARPTSRCILFDGENIFFDASLVIYIQGYS